jgi:hypothetical protein
VEACAVKLAAAMEGERTRPAVPTHRESTAAESTTTESATHSVRAHTTSMRGHTTAVSATAVSTTTVSATTVSTTAVSAATTRRRNGWSKGDRRADCGGGGNGHDALSEHDSASLVSSPPSRS